MNLSKYKAQATDVDGIRFHSKKESRRYSELKLLQRAGEIQDLELQPVFPLFVISMQHWDRLMGHDDDSELRMQMCGEYRADFRYTNVRDGEIIVEDVKGMKTPLYRLKKKMTEGIYGIRIVEL